MTRIVMLFLFTCTVSCGFSQQNRWALGRDGSIDWVVKTRDTAHADHIEMSGKQLSAIITYGIQEGRRLLLKKKLIFPMLRTIPNDTRGSLQWNVDEQAGASITINDKPAEETVLSFNLNGMLNINSELAKDVVLVHHVFPSTDKAALVDKCQVINNSSSTVKINIPQLNLSDSTNPGKGVYGSYFLNTTVYDGGSFELKPGDELSYSVVWSARKSCDQPYTYSALYEYEKRKAFLFDTNNNLVLETPDEVVNSMFGFAKIRVTESIYDTKNGLMHGPGGGSYYAAIWANDQAEYANPFFPFLGNAEGNESAMNSFRLFAKYMNKDYKPIPSSIIAEGAGFWDGAGDRGDQAMIAYGASTFALAYADRDEAKKLWPLIEWCLEFLRRKKTAEGVIQSDADELEGRFPAGKINLSTNTLAYGALTNAASLALALKDSSTSSFLLSEAAALKQSIEKYFGSTVQGYKTYRYYDGNDKLRSWIGLPLAMGIFDRKEETLKALYSPYLWTKNGMLTEAGSATYWDRALLYALRGTFYAGYTDSTAKYLEEYSRKRLLGEHVPYAIEAWPEGNQQHLAAESGLYCRAITEGLFGMHATGFNSFEMQPLMPENWTKMSLKHIRAFQGNFDIYVERKGKQYEVKVAQDGGAVQKFTWPGLKPIQVNLK
ncbi:hypothetical protein [Parafilimonas sp.]|uniref:hypothetical protein n=1 Tax=Parafilimonas sp. TaxID=1969739 RepID=UPI0039E72475